MEDDSLKTPFSDRILAAAGRILDEKPPAIRSGVRLRSDQLPVFRDFATYLTDLATSRPSH